MTVGFKSTGIPKLFKKKCAKCAIWYPKVGSPGLLILADFLWLIYPS